MEFVWVCIGMIVVLGVIAAIANRFDKGKDSIEQGHDCSPRRHRISYARSSENTRIIRSSGKKS